MNVTFIVLNVAKIKGSEQSLQVAKGKEDYLILYAFENIL